MQSALSVNDFIKGLAKAGINGNFRATNGEITIVGSIDVNGVITKHKVQSVAESREKINNLFKNGSL